MRKSERRAIRYVASVVLITAFAIGASAISADQAGAASTGRPTANQSK